jgi:uncharacterized protein (DUF433 family)
MTPVIQADAPPLRRDSSGALRVGQSRMLLDLVVHGFQDGLTPEAIVQRYPTLTLPETYAAIAYYLNHREDIELYLAERETRAAEVRQRIEGRQGELAELRARLLARRDR